MHRSEVALIGSLLLALIVPPPLRGQAVDASGAAGGSPPQQTPEIQVERVRLLHADSLFGEVAVSPDGRWLAYSDGTLHLLRLENDLPAGAAVPLVSPGSGEPITGAWPRWSGSATLFFTGPDPLEHQPLYRLDLDASTPAATVTDSPRRVSLDPVFRSYSLSPEGDSVAYLHHPSTGPTRTVKVMSALGGPATIVAGPDRLVSPVWTSEGIYYLRQTAVGETATELYRVVPGREPERVADFAGSTLIDRRARLIVHPLCFNSWIGMCGTPTVSGLDGELLGVLDVPEGQVRGGADGELFVATYGTTYAGRVVDLATGETRAVTDSRFSWIDTWIDNDRVAYSSGTPLGDHELFTYEPGTGVTEALGLEDTAMRTTSVAGGRWRLHGVKDPERDRTILTITDVDSGTQRVVTRNGTWTRAGGLQGHILGRGGYLRRDGDTFLYSTEGDGVQEIWSVEPDGTPERLWRFPPGRRFVKTAVAGDRVAFSSHGPNGSGPVGVPQRILLAGPGVTEPRVLYEAAEGTTADAPVWSRDGRRLAFVASDGIRLLAMEAGGAEPTFSLDPRVLRLPTKYPMSLYWDAEDRGLVVLGFATEDDPDATAIWHIDLETERTARVSREEGPIWEFRMSPDGRRIVYPLEVPGGIDLWRVRMELPDRRRRSEAR